ncbi:hypothetical protein Mal4_30680 [Maioricimonas rarisocia]|uniref:Uncharacterized protein n=1 Tax=Maioricimonas rarisocia TaxID=2528026 RepID=A0A517Z8D7_9PLAN|nr:hypothetical protein [Maioricimonas rarisocia]QDU38738.1 hypothetical protein Mal4_30680 [Maioricimonas rarisocia]
MKSLKTLAAVAIAAAGFAFFTSDTAEAGCHGGYCGPRVYNHAYGHGFGYHRNFYARPVRILCDAYGCDYFVDPYGVRYNVHLDTFGKYYFFDRYHTRRYIRHFHLGY